MKEKIIVLSGLLLLVIASFVLFSRMRTVKALPQASPVAKHSRPEPLAMKIQSNTRNLYPVQQENRWGYIDQTGKIVIQPIYSMAFEFHEGLAHVMVNDKWGYIDETGRMVIQPQFARADRFYEGFARVSFDPETREFPGFIDRTGNLVIDFDDAEYLGYFSEGLASVRVNGKFGFVNADGDFVIQPAYDVADAFTEGLAKVANGGESGYQWGFIDKEGNLKIPLQFDDAGKFSEGLATVRTGNLFGFIDHTGNFAIVPQFDYAGDFQNNLAPVAKVKFGYCDHAGNMVIPPRFDVAGPFNGDLASVAMEGEKGPLWGFIDKSGEIVIQPQYDSVGGFTSTTGFVDGIAQVDVGNYVGYIDKTGKYVWRPCYNCNK